ncbi:MAG: endopeptidase La, partial [Schleiferiaceae bacterium]|nr:endopeptidase La [Schleiferiaceae bacterium]
AMAYIKANAEKLGIDAKLFTSYDIHVHVPEGAIPKDGPSAGVTLLTALTSLFTQRKVKAKLAMSGEITLRGNVLPVGGLREKILAAKRSGINQILLCKDNRKDVDEIPPKYIKGMHIHYVSEMLEVIDFALLSTKVKDAKQLLA